MGTDTNDSRGVSEGLGVAVLIIITVVAISTVGLTAILATGEDTEKKEKSTLQIKFEYYSKLKQLVILYTGEDEPKAGNIVINGVKGNVSWATLANVKESTPVKQNSEVILNENSGYGSKVTKKQNISVTYNPPNGTAVTKAWKPTRKGKGGESGKGPASTPPAQIAAERVQLSV